MARIITGLNPVSAAVTILSMTPNERVTYDAVIAAGGTVTQQIYYNDLSETDATSLVFHSGAKDNYLELVGDSKAQPLSISDKWFSQTAFLFDRVGDNLFISNYDIYKYQYLPSLGKRLNKSNAVYEEARLGSDITLSDLTELTAQEDILYWKYYVANMATVIASLSS